MFFFDVQLFFGFVTSTLCSQTMKYVFIAKSTKLHTSWWLVEVDESSDLNTIKTSRFISTLLITNCKQYSMTKIKITENLQILGQKTKYIQ